VVAGAAQYAKGADPDETIVTMFTGHGLKVGDKLHKLVSD
jgi:threonine synthase